MNPQPALAPVARAMVECAVEDSAAQLGLSVSDLVVRLHESDCYLCDIVRASLARQIAHYLSFTDPDLHAIYLYDPEQASANFEHVRRGPSASSALSLIAWTEHENQELRRTLPALERGLAEELADIRCEKGTGICYHLDMVIVDDDEVRHRRGYGALLGSLTSPPTRVWSRH